MGQRAWQSAAYDARPCTSLQPTAFFRSAYLRQATVVARSHIFIAGSSPQTQHAGVYGAPPRIA